MRQSNAALERRKAELGSLDNLVCSYLNMAGVYAPPVPTNIISLFDIGRHVHIEKVPLNGNRGMLDYDEGEWLLLVNERDTQRAQRFTIFHEAGHIIERTTGWPFAIQGEPHRQWVCECFAARMLMPVAFMLRSTKQTSDMYRLAALFQVSSQAMQRRLRELGLGG